MNPRKLLVASLALVSILLPLGAFANLGGGWVGGGLTGTYYSGSSFTGSTFVRTDVRLDFPVGSPAPGGSIDPAYAAVPSTNWSASWTGQLIPQYTEQYTFRYECTACTMTITPVGGSATTLINASGWTGWKTVNYNFIAGDVYNIAINFHATGAWGFAIHWYCTTGANPFPEEAIEPATPVGINLDQCDRFGSGALGASYASTSFTGSGPALSSGWPSGDFTLLGLYAAGTTNGIEKVTYTGAAQLYDNASGGSGGNNFLIGYSSSSKLGSMSINGQTYYEYAPLPFATQHWDPVTGTGYNSTTNTTTLLYSPVTYESIGFEDTDRSGNGGSPALNGITNLTVQLPTTLNGTTQLPVGTIYTPEDLQVSQPYTALRLMEWTGTCYATDSTGYVNTTDWANRTHPLFCFQADLTANTYGNPWGPEWPWEYAVMLANETGKDLYINLPGSASGTDGSSNYTSSYMYQLAELIKYGSTGTSPYSTAQTSPTFPPLNPNLNVYIEYGNENWGGQPPSYPQVVTVVNAAKTANNTDWQQYTSAGGTVTSSTANIQLWTTLRMKNASALFRDVYGNSAMPSSSNGTVVTDPRVRPLDEWQYGGQWNGGSDTSQTALTAVDTEFSLDANYYLWGGGGGWYSTNEPALSGGLNGIFADPGTPTATGAPTIPSELQSIASYSGAFNNVLSDTAVCQEFGLHGCGYEGGFSFGGGYPSLTGYPYYTIGADADSRTIPLEEAILAEYYQSTPQGSLPIVFYATDNINVLNGVSEDGWALMISPWDQEPYTTNPPKLTGIEDFSDNLAPTTLPDGWSNIVIGSTTSTGGVATGPDPYGYWYVLEANPNDVGFYGGNGGTYDNYAGPVTTVSGGNVTMIAELIQSPPSSNEGTNPGAGLIFRVSTDPSCPRVSLFSEQNGSPNFHMAWRTTEGGTIPANEGSSGSIVPPGALADPQATPVWLKLTEVNGTFTGYVSTDDATWTEISSVTISSSAFPTSSFLAGLANDSNAGTWPTMQTLAVYQNVSATDELTDLPTNVYIGTTGDAGHLGTAAFDNNLSTYFEGPDASGDWCGENIGNQALVTQISYADATGDGAGMVGGIFEASNSSTFATYTALYTVPSAPSDGVLYTAQVPDSLQGPYQYVRYIGPTGANCEVGEADFYGTLVEEELTGLPGDTYIGTAGSYESDGDIGANAFDNNDSTYFSGPDASGDWCGENLGAPAVVTQISYADRPSYGSRLEGGEFEASASSTFATYTTLYTIPSTPVPVDYTYYTVPIPASLQGPYQYVRYVGPSGTYCNISEADFYGIFY